MGMPEGSVVIPEGKSRLWSARAIQAVFAARAVEVDRLSKHVVLVPTKLKMDLPNRYQVVSKKEAGESVILQCRGVRALLDVSIREIRAAKDGTVVADLTISGYGATCDRAERRVVQEGIDCYRIIFGRGRPVVLFQSSLAL